MANTWEQRFRELLRERGYDNPHISYDPITGFLVNYGDGEIEAHSPRTIELHIQRLPASGPGGDGDAR